MTLLSRSDLQTYADVHYEDNTTGEIVEEEVRTGYKNMADSAIIKNEAGDLGAGLEWNADVIRIKAAGVTLAMMENRAQGSFIGRKAAAGTGAPQEMSASEAKTILAISASDVSGLSAFATSTDLVNATGTLAIARIADGSVTYAKIANGTGLSVFGRSANSGGVNADIVGVDGQVLRVSGTALGFGTIVAAGIASDAITTAKILDANVTLVKMENRAQGTFIGRKAAAGTGAPQEMSASEAKTILAIASTDVSGLSAFATSTDLVNATGTLDVGRIADASLTFAKFPNVFAESLLGRDTSGMSGPPTQLNAATVKAFLHIDVNDVSGLSAFALSTDLISATGTLAIARIADGTVTLAKMANLAQSTIVGRAAGAGTGVPTALTAAQVITLLALGTAALKDTGTAGNTVPLLDGANTFSAQTIISLTSTAAALILESTDAGANLGGNLILRRSSASPAVSDFINSIEHHGFSSTGVERVYARTYAQIVSPTNAAESGGWYLDTIRAGTVTNEMFVAGGVQLSNPSGGFKGVGTLNALQLYQNGSLINTAAFTAPDASTIEIFGTTLRVKDAGITLAKMANLLADTIIGRANGAGTGVPGALTAAQVTAIIKDAFTGITMTTPLTMDGTVLSSTAVLTTLRTTTADASDNAELRITHGTAGAASRTHGAFIRLFGNEHASTGDLLLTAGEAGNVVPLGQNIDGLFFGSKTYDPPSTATGAAWQTTVTVTGAAVGDLCLAAHSQVTTQLWIISAQVSSANTVTVTGTNNTGGTVDLSSGTLRVMVLGAPA